MSPLPNTCNEKDPGSMRFCCEPPDHDGPHGYSMTEVAWGVRRTVYVTWEEQP